MTNDNLAVRFFGTLKVRLQERRSQRLICLLKCYYNGRHSSESQNTFSNLNKTATSTFMEDLFRKFFEYISCIQTPTEIMGAVHGTQRIHESFQSQMAQVIEKIKGNVLEILTRETRVTFKKEFKLFEATGKRMKVYTTL